MPGKQKECIKCGKCMRSDNLKRHVQSCNLGPDNLSRQQTSVKQNSAPSQNKSSTNIPEFDGAEFSRDKPLSSETMIKIMDMLNVPEEKREQIIRDHSRSSADENSSVSENDKECEVSSEIGDDTLTDAEVQETVEDFQKLFSDLMENKNRENIEELINIVNIWGEAGEINAEECQKLCTGIKTAWQEV